MPFFTKKTLLATILAAIGSLSVATAAMAREDALPTLYEKTGVLDHVACYIGKAGDSFLTLKLTESPSAQFYKSKATLQQETRMPLGSTVATRNFLDKCLQTGIQEGAGSTVMGLASDKPNAIFPTQLPQIGLPSNGLSLIMPATQIMPSITTNPTTPVPIVDTNIEPEAPPPPLNPVSSEPPIMPKTGVKPFGAYTKPNLW
jgi:hypothetical protein